MKRFIQNTRTSYDRVAVDYADRYKDEMDDKPFDRDCLDRLASEVGDLGPIPHEQVVDALCEMKRVLKPGGVLLVTLHIGEEIKHIDEWWEQPVNLDFAFYLPDQMEAWLNEAGLDLMETLVREPIPAMEVATRRAYLFARKPTL